jgi:hypothetical protein
MNFIQNKIQANNGRQPSGRLPDAIKDHLPDSTPVEQVKSCVLERPEISSAAIADHQSTLFQQPYHLDPYATLSQPSGW